MEKCKTRPIRIRRIVRRDDIRIWTALDNASNCAYEFIKKEPHLWGPEVKDEFFKNENPIGKTIKLNDTNFEVIGVTKEKKMSIQNFNNMVFIPITTMGTYLSGRNDALELWVYFKEGYDVIDLKENIKQALFKSSGLKYEGVDYYTIELS